MPLSFHRFSRSEMEILERLLVLFQRLQKLRIDEREYVVMKVINFLNQDVKHLENPVAVEDINKTYASDNYWYQKVFYLSNFKKSRF